MPQYDKRETKSHQQTNIPDGPGEDIRPSRRAGGRVLFIHAFCAFADSGFRPLLLRVELRPKRPRPEPEIPLLKGDAGLPFP
jgi:hypothetical protein